MFDIWRSAQQILVNFCEDKCVEQTERHLNYPMNSHISDIGLNWKSLSIAEHLDEYSPEVVEATRIESCQSRDSHV